MNTRGVLTDADIVARIEGYWRERGYQVEVGVRFCEEPQPHPHGPARYYAVRSNMRNGLPRRYSSGDLGMMTESDAPRSQSKTRLMWETDFEVLG